MTWAGAGAQDIPSLQEVGGVQFHVVAMWKFMSSVTPQFSSVAQSCLTLQPNEPQHARPPCPSPTPGVLQDT